MPDSEPLNQSTYTNALKDACRPGGDTDLPRLAANLSTLLISFGAHPRDIVAMHTVAADAVVGPNEGRELVVAQQFLLEVLVAYGLAYSSLAEQRLAETDAMAASEQGLAEDAERAEKDRLDLLAGVSHELGSPLTVIKANVTSIRRFLEERNSWPEELSQREDDVEFAVERILALREELLAASRNEPREIETVPVQIHRSLQRVVRWARIAAHEKELTVNEAYGSAVPHVMGDEWAVQSIFGNLLSNAVRYTPAGGRINVQADIRPGRRKSDPSKYVCLAVADTGPGVGDQDLIFEEVYRVERRGNHPGFRLAISRRIARLLGGELTLETSDDGSVFTLWLPGTSVDPKQERQ
jgi:signal transduction histidine kinase